MGLLNNAVPFPLLAWGQTHIAGGLAAILNATTPLFTVIVAHRFTADEKLTPARLLGVTAGFVGVAVMVGGAALRTFGVEVLALLGVLLLGETLQPNQLLGMALIGTGLAAVDGRPWAWPRQSAGRERL